MPTIPTYTADQFARRIGRDFPSRWASDDAKLPSGVVYSKFYSVGTQLAYMLGQLQYVKNATRMSTETSPELDLASVDFFGPDELPRPGGMSDTDFYHLIQANLFKPAATRQAISNAIQNITNAAPRMIDSWNPADTGVWSGPLSYWGVDNVVTPWLWGALKPYQGFISVSIGTTPLVSFPSPGQSIVYSTVNRLRAYGCGVWVKFV